MTARPATAGRMLWEHDTVRILIGVGGLVVSVGRWERAVVHFHGEFARGFAAVLCAASGTPLRLATPLAPEARGVQAESGVRCRTRAVENGSAPAEIHVARYNFAGRVDALRLIISSGGIVLATATIPQTRWGGLRRYFKHHYGGDAT